MSTKSKQSSVINAITTFLQEGGSLDQVDTVITQLEKVAEEQAKKHMVIVTSAQPLSKTQQTTIKTTMRRYFPDYETVEFTTDKTNIAGLHIRYRDQVLDLTIAQTLDQLTRSIR